jgi:hypothetical protein
MDVQQDAKAGLDGSIEAASEAEKFCTRLAKAFVEKGIDGSRWDRALVNVPADSGLGQHLRQHEEKYKDIFVRAMNAIRSEDEVADIADEEGERAWFVLGKNLELAFEELPRKKYRPQAESEVAMRTFQNLFSHVQDNATATVCLRAFRALEGSTLCAKECLLIYATRIMEGTPSGARQYDPIMLATCVLASAAVADAHSSHSNAEAATHVCACTASIVGEGAEHLFLVLGHLARLEILYDCETRPLLKALYDRIVRRRRPRGVLLRMKLNVWCIISMLATHVFLGDDADVDGLGLHLYTSVWTADLCEETLALMVQELQAWDLGDDFQNLDNSVLNFDTLTEFGARHRTQFLAACASILDRATSSAGTLVSEDDYNPS